MIDRPLRRVVTAQVIGGASLFASFKYRWWRLRLECNHVVERRIRYLPIANAPRGYGAQWRGVPPQRIGPAPKAARCEDCPTYPDTDL